MPGRFGVRSERNLWRAAFRFGWIPVLFLPGRARLPQSGIASVSAPPALGQARFCYASLHWLRSHRNCPMLYVVFRGVMIPGARSMPMQALQPHRAGMDQTQLCTAGCISGGSIRSAFLTRVVPVAVHIAPVALFRTLRRRISPDMNLCVCMSRVRDREAVSLVFATNRS